MVKEIKRADKKIYQCEECKLLYDEKIWATKCEEWCKNNHTCNIEITKHRIKEKEK
jgi:hypothetical protein